MVSRNSQTLPKGTSHTVPEPIIEALSVSTANHLHPLERVCRDKWLSDEALQLLNDITKAIAPWSFVHPTDTWVLPWSAKEQASVYATQGEAAYYHLQHVDATQWVLHVSIHGHMAVEHIVADPYHPPKWEGGATCRVATSDSEVSLPDDANLGPRHTILGMGALALEQCC